MKTRQQLHNQLQQVAAFKQLLLAQHSQELISHDALCYMLVLLVLGKLPTKNDPRELYPILVRKSFHDALNPWECALDKTKQQFQMCVPLNKHPDPSYTDDNIEIIMPPLVVFLLDKYGLPAQNRPIFSSETIDNAHTWLSRYAPSKFSHGFECNFLSDIQAINQCLLDFMPHHVRFNKTYRVFLHGVSPQKNGPHPKESVDKASLDKVTGHAGHVYESITVADLQDDIAQIYEQYCQVIINAHHTISTKHAHCQTSFFHYSEGQYTSRIQSIVRKSHENKHLYTQITHDTRDIKLLSSSEEQQLLDFVNAYSEYTGDLYQDFNAISTQCLLVFLLLTSLRPHHDISGYQTLNLDEQTMVVKDKGKRERESRFIYLHPRLCELIHCYFDCKTRLANKLKLTKLTLSRHVIFEQLHNQAWSPFKAATLQTIYRQIGLSQDNNILRHHINYQMMRFKLPAKHRNYIMGHGNQYDRNMLMTSEIKQALNQLFDHYRLEPVVDRLIKRIEKIK